MIKENRIKKNYTQEYLAELLDISTRQLQRIERNEFETSIKTIKKAIEILDIPDNEILEYMKKRA